MDASSLMSFLHHCVSCFRPLKNEVCFEGAVWTSTEYHSALHSAQHHAFCALSLSTTALHCCTREAMQTRYEAAPNEFECYTISTT